MYLERIGHNKVLMSVYERSIKEVKFGVIVDNKLLDVEFDSIIDAADYARPLGGQACYLEQARAYMKALNTK